jgi:hypothetical protein
MAKKAQAQAVEVVRPELGGLKEKPKTRQDLLKLYKQAHLELKKGKGGPKPQPGAQAPEA